MALGLRSNLVSLLLSDLLIPGAFCAGTTAVRTPSAHFNTRRAQWEYSHVIGCGASLIFKTRSDVRVVEAYREIGTDLVGAREGLETGH